MHVQSVRVRLFEVRTIEGDKGSPLFGRLAGCRLEMRQRNAFLDVAGLEVTLGGKAILQGIDLAVRAGEIVALLGPNGAGKSTLIRTICGQIKPGQGHILIAGEDPARARRSVGLVPQKIALFEKLTPKENLTSFGAIMGVGRGDLRVRAEALLERVGLADRINDPLHNLSGGMQRRVNIAAALMHNPGLLVLDEPTVGLDYDAQHGIAELLQGLRSDGAAILLVTHDLPEAELLADRLAILVQGKIRALGIPEQLIEQAFENLRDISVVGPQSSAVDTQDESVLSLKEALERVGLSPDASGKAWAGFLALDDPRLARLLDAIANQELSAEEVTIRRAGLEMLLARCVSDAAQEAA